MRSSMLLAALLVPACSHGLGEPPSPSTGPVAVLPALSSTAPPAVPAPPPTVYRVPVGGLPAIGDDRALVTMVAFYDYECPFSRRADATVAQLRQRYGADLRVVVAERPLPMHDRARPAALAALAAGRQGAFDAMNARLFAAPLDDASIAAAVRDLGLDAARFDEDRVHAAADALASSEALADRLGVHGTPTFFVNGRRVVGAQPFEELQAVVDERLAAARALVASGVRPRDVYERIVSGGLERVQEGSDDHGAGCHGDGECHGAGDAPAAGEKVERVPIDGAPARGPSTATVTIVEFADFQCPYCVKAEATLHAVEQAHAGEVRIVWKNLALPFHAFARPMAKAAMAAGAQGRYWEMHDRLFRLTPPVERATLDGVASELGLDVARFDHDLDDATLDARLDADAADAKALGVDGTPTFFVNGHRVVGAQPAAVFEKAIGGH